MKFVEPAGLRAGMRLARSVYDKAGEVLFDRDEKLTAQTIDGMKQMGLLGAYVLEPAEPFPPLSEEEKESERFQAETAFCIQEEMEQILNDGQERRLQSIIGAILKRYGHLDGKRSFFQSPRSRDDFISRHALNTAVLTAMITHGLNMRVDEQLLCMYAAVLHDIGKLLIPKELFFGREDDPRLLEQLYQGQLAGLDAFETAVQDGGAVKRICTQALRLAWEAESEKAAQEPPRLLPGAKVLLVANRYDEMTAMTPQGAVSSEVRAIRELEAYPQMYDPETVAALFRSVEVLAPGVSVELNTGEKALIIAGNPRDALRPVVLTFGDNTPLDLSLKENRDIEITDVSKTMDSRYLMGT